MLKKRVIPVILIDNNGKVFKTEKFDNPNYIGDVFNTIKILNEYEVDEIFILDIEATKKKLSPNYSLLQKISTESFVPLTYGGGIDNLEKIEKIFSLGFEKISINRQIIPFGLNISIKKRKPVAYGERLKDGKNLLGFIDKNGHFITEKYSDKDYIKDIKIKVFGWEEKYRDLLAEILNSSNTEEVELKSITFSKNGFLTLEEKDLKTIVLGFNSNIIKKQILIIKNLKKQLVQENIKEKILNIDLTDPNNPKIKVFKP